VVKFRSKTPKVINLTEQERLPASLIEKAIRCKNEEKDVYMFYYLQQKAGESTIIFCNSITCVMRVNSMLSFLKIKNFPLHSKM
jgi:ATP-dependent RNA helicase DDX24/MAK5